MTKARVIRSLGSLAAVMYRLDVVRPCRAQHPTLLQMRGFRLASCVRRILTVPSLPVTGPVLLMRSGRRFVLRGRQRESLQSMTIVGSPPQAMSPLAPIVRAVGPRCDPEHQELSGPVGSDVGGRHRFVGLGPPHMSDTFVCFCDTDFLLCGMVTHWQ